VTAGPLNKIATKPALAAISPATAREQVARRVD
jgi:hypothetical protein